MILQIQLSCEKIMLPLSQTSHVSFVVKGLQCQNIFDTPSPFNKRYEGHLVDVLTRIDGDFNCGENGKKIQSKIVFSKKFIKRMFVEIDRHSDDDNYIDQAYLTYTELGVVHHIKIVKKTKVSQTIVHCNGEHYGT